MRAQTGPKPAHGRMRMIRFASALVLLAIPLVRMDDALAQTATPVSITLTSYAFDPSALNLKAGTTYHLHFINSGSKDHNFSAPEFFAAAQVAPEDQAKVEKGRVALEGGQSLDITVTPDRPGIFAVECTHFMHSMMGMHGSIVVQ
jgi:plastocyanin